MRFENVCLKSGVSPPTTNRRNRGPQYTHFRRLRNLTATLTAYIFRMKCNIHNRASAWKLQGVSYIASKCHELWSTNGIKWDRRFYPPSVNSAFYFIARLHTRMSANKTQGHYRPNLGALPPNVKNLTWRSVHFSTFWVI